MKWEAEKEVKYYINTGQGIEKEVGEISFVG